MTSDMSIGMVLLGESRQGCSPIMSLVAQSIVTAVRKWCGISRSWDLFGWGALLKQP